MITLTEISQRQDSDQYEFQPCIINPYHFIVAKEREWIPKIAILGEDSAKPRIVSEIYLRGQMPFGVTETIKEVYAAIKKGASETQSQVI